jgi:hypothetical protein
MGVSRERPPIPGYAAAADPRHLLSPSTSADGLSASTKWPAAILKNGPCRPHPSPEGCQPSHRGTDHAHT